MTTAAIAFSSRPVAAIGCAEFEPACQDDAAEAR